MLRFSDYDEMYEYSPEKEVTKPLKRVPPKVSRKNKRLFQESELRLFDSSTKEFYTTEKAMRLIEKYYPVLLSHPNEHLYSLVLHGLVGKPFMRNHKSRRRAASRQQDIGALLYRLKHSNRNKKFSVSRLAKQIVQSMLY